MSQSASPVPNDCTTTNQSDYAQVDADVKCKFRHEWLDKLVPLNADDGIHYPAGVCIHKANEPGMALCTWCKCEINYGSTGFKALAIHTTSKKHVEKGMAIKAGYEDAGGWEGEMAKHRPSYTIIFQEQLDSKIIKILDANVKNKFKLSWLERVARVGDQKYCLRSCYNKVDLPGQALCTWCNELVNYGCSGGKSLEAHAMSLKHHDRATLAMALGDVSPSDDDRSTDKAFYHIHVGVDVDAIKSDIPPNIETIVGKGYVLVRDDSNDYDVRILDEGLKNRFRWDWMSKICIVDGWEYPYGNCFKNINTPGQVMCIWCDVPISYSRSGCKGLEEHLKTSKHIRNSKMMLSCDAGSFSKALEGSSSATPIKAGPSSSSTTSSTTGDTDVTSSQLHAVDLQENTAEWPNGSPFITLASEKQDQGRQLQQAGYGSNSRLGQEREEEGGVVEETRVQDYVKVIRCREYITTRKNLKTGMVTILSHRNEEDAPVLTSVRTTISQSRYTDTNSQTNHSQRKRSRLSGSENASQAGRTVSEQDETSLFAIDNSLLRTVDSDLASVVSQTSDQSARSLSAFAKHRLARVAVKTEPEVYMDYDDNSIEDQDFTVVKVENSDTEMDNDFADTLMSQSLKDRAVQRCSDCSRLFTTHSKYKAHIVDGFCSTKKVELTQRNNSQSSTVVAGTSQPSVTPQYSIEIAGKSHASVTPHYSIDITKQSHTAGTSVQPVISQQVPSENTKTKLLRELVSSSIIYQ